ncbi:MAG: hypothetical protein D6675_04820 [Gemmatimonadetes bacterium]|nr:MAG: hypothetical protein D6675_04820 [Gemmatimonadota bacterium]
MKLTFKDDGKLILAYLKGDLNEKSAENFKTLIRREVLHEKRPILLNLDKLAHIDSHGFDAIGSVMTAVTSGGMGFSIYVSPENESVMNLLKASPYFEFLPVFTEEVKARHDALRPRRKSKK